MTAMELQHASQVRSDWYRALLKLFQSYDYLLLPSAQVFPFDAQEHWPKEINGKKMDTYHRWMEVVIPATMAGLPAISVPVGFGSTGLPMGMQVIGKPPRIWRCCKLRMRMNRRRTGCEIILPPLLKTAAWKKNQEGKLRRVLAPLACNFWANERRLPVRWSTTE